jgi:hypothetical protein
LRLIFAVSILNFGGTTLKGEKERWRRPRI